MMTEGKPVDGCRWAAWSRRRCLFFILVFAVLFYFFSTDIKDMAPDWRPKWSHPAHWWIPFESQRVDEVNRAEFNSSNSGPGSAPEPTSTSTSASTSAAAAPKTRSTALLQTEKVPPAPQEVNTKASTPVPYVDPGPYVVEYPAEYHFTINEPQRCEQEKPFVVLMVPLAPHNRRDRDIIRSTWGSESPVQGREVKLFFLLGLKSSHGAAQLQEELQQESREHHDMIQADFIDSYKNLTIKTMVMLEWLDAYCSGASYAMKIDSDTFLNVPNLVGLLVNAPKTDYMTGLVARGGAVLRDTSSKWYVPVELFAAAEYPRYALGLGYIVSLDLPKKLIEASRHVRALYIEDVYLGLCMQYLGIPPTDPPNWNHFNVFPVAYNRCAFSRIITTTTNSNMDRVWVWKDFKTPGPYC
ncbi:beta-1,3-galactosyltransferase 1-like [Embiotoca jacksoni]|uniref:beta-1,3-galactosyltransferase 1-like n=1 Tax=Embiotoca jacksoni TaxID=100190 RepID=UPI003703C42A